MGTTAKVRLRGFEWTANPSDGRYGGIATVTRFGPNAGQYEVIPCADLQPEEQTMVFQAIEAAAREVNQKELEAQKRFEAQKKEDNRLLAEGAAYLRDAVWHVESDHVWRNAQVIENNEWVWGTVRLKFSELTNDELASVMQAKERQGMNRGIGGFFRRLNRKLDQFVSGGMKMQ